MPNSLNRCILDLKDRVRMALSYRNIGNVLTDQGNYDQASQYHNKALEIHEELKDRLEIARDYRSIGDVLANTRNHKAAMESFSNGLEILQDLEEQTAYRHPLTEIIQECISKLHE
jgi:tetratricopeptide (TPR) repeat protein